MLGQQAEETEEDFFDALGEAVLADAVLLDGGEVGEKEVVEHAQAVVGKRKTHLLIVNHHLHQFAQTAKIVGFQREYGRGKFHHREVGCADGIAPNDHSALVSRQITFPSHSPSGKGRFLSCQNSFKQNYLIDTGSEVILVDTGLPAGFPEEVPNEDSPIFPESQKIADGIYLIKAKGHTKGNSIIIVEMDGLFYMLHGDITYVDEALHEDKLSVVFDDLPDDWRCPRCKQPKSKFNPA